MKHKQEKIMWLSHKTCSGTVEKVTSDVFKIIQASNASVMWRKLQLFFLLHTIGFLNLKSKNVSQAPETEYLNDLQKKIPQPQKGMPYPISISFFSAFELGSNLLSQAGLLLWLPVCLSIRSDCSYALRRLFLKIYLSCLLCPFGQPLKGSCLPRSWSSQDCAPEI